jgi:hypothetical protein
MTLFVIGSGHPKDGMRFHGCRGGGGEICGPLDWQPLKNVWPGKSSVKEGITIDYYYVPSKVVSYYNQSAQLQYSKTN